MEGTSGTPNLLTDVDFSVTRKGYDPAEVDAYLEKVGAAVAQLQSKLREAATQIEAAEGRVAEATKAKDSLQSRIETLERELTAALAAGGTLPPRNPAEEAEQASKVLVLAQRTADAAIEEAKVSAEAALADARQQAEGLVAEAEQEAVRLLERSRAELEGQNTARRQELAAEVHELERVREAVRADVDVVQRHVEEQLAVLRASLERLHAVIGDPSAFRAVEEPATSGASLADVQPAPDLEPAVTLVDAEGASAPADGGVGAAPSDQADVLGAEAAEVPAGDAVDGEAAAGPPDDAAAEATDTGATATDAVDMKRATSGESGGEAATPTAPGTQDPQATGTYDVLSGDDESPLGPVDEEADAAMRAFFEAEFDDDRRRS